MAAVAAALGAAQNRILHLCRNHPTGVTDNIFEEECKDVSLQNRALGLNDLLQQGRVQRFKQGDSLIWKEQTKEQADMTSQGSYLFATVTQLPVTAKHQQGHLDGRNLMKAVKSIAVKNRMLFDLEPAREMPGLA